jgi:hypothetical protein
MAVLGQLLTPLMDRRIRNAQLAGHLGNRLAAGLGQPPASCLNSGVYVF